jgi:hypothetical protein
VEYDKYQGDVKLIRGWLENKTRVKTGWGNGKKGNLDHGL